MVSCQICKTWSGHYLGPHLQHEHQMGLKEYAVAYPNSPNCSTEALTAYLQSKGSNPSRTAPVPEQLTVDLGTLTFPVNTDVPEIDCLPMPPHYRLPVHGELSKDIMHALVALKQRRSIYIWGLPGTGKDALVHAWSAMTRSPALLFQVQPQVDIQHWMFSRGFDSQGTTWEEGVLFRALRDGYTTSTGRKIPYTILLSDFDRADRSQAEYLRLVIDSIQGRVKGPQGTTYPVFPGTVILVTANAPGGGDARGRMVSSNVLDASLLDRFDRFFQFHWMDWADEEPILRAKFPLLVSKLPGALDMMRNVTQSLRQAIYADEIHGEFSHRALCNILGHAEDLIICTGRVPGQLLKFACRAWVDILPDEEAQTTAWSYIDAHLKGGAVNEGDTSHIDKGPLEV